MWTKLEFFLFQVSLICLARGIVYEFIADNKSFLQHCEGESKNVLGLDEAFNFSSMIIQSEENKPLVHFSGYYITNWPGVDPSDTISLLGQLYQRDPKNVWQPTMYSASTKNFCTDLFDKSTYFYKFYSQYISNVAEVKDKCIINPDVVIKHEDFDLKLSVNVPYAPSIVGHRKLVITIEAFDQNKKKRPISICTEIYGVVRQG